MRQTSRTWVRGFVEAFFSSLSIVNFFSFLWGLYFRPWSLIVWTCGFCFLDEAVHHFGLLAQENSSVEFSFTENLSDLNSDVNSIKSTAEFSVPALTFFSGNSFDPVDPQKKPIVLTAGHITFRWKPHPDARGYRIIDQTGQVHYEGRMAVGFVSGLADGDYAFTTVALDEDADPIDSSQTPVRVTVAHHPMMITWIIFSIGACVMVCLFTVILVGVRRGEGQ